MKACLEARAPIKKKQASTKKGMREKQQENSGKKQRIADVKVQRSVADIETKEKPTWNIKDYKSIQMTLKRRLL
jgi:hypothetical protein